MTAWSVMLRGIRYRPGRSLGVFLLALVATTAAVLAPAYSRAAQQSVLTDGLRSAPADATSLVVGAKGTADATPAAFSDLDEIRLAVTRQLTREPAVADRLGHPTGAVDTDVTLPGPAGTLVAKFARREGACAYLRITGSCATEPGQILISQRTAGKYGLTPGRTLTLRLGSRTNGHDHVFEIVGLYTPKDATDAYWGRTLYFTAGATDPDTGDERIDTVFTGTADDVRKEHSATLYTRLEYPLRTDEVRLDDVTAVRDGITQLATNLRRNDVELTTALPSVLDQVAGDQAAIGRTAPVIAVPLVLLCWFVLFLLVASLTEERGPEIALAKLRGYPSGRATRFGLGEALLLIALAAPAGLAAGYALVELAARLVLAGGTHAEPRWPLFAAAGVALLGAVAAAVLAGRRTVGREVLGLLRRVPERRRWQAGVAEGVVVALAAASLVAAAGDRTAPLALLAPPLLAVVAGIATARLLGLWARFRLRTARRGGRLAPMLAAAQLSRRPSGQRVVVVVTVAVALLSFAATAWDVAAQARRDRAADTLGAPRVYTVVADHPTALMSALGKADPSGHTMAVVRTSQRYGDGVVELLGVQASRLPSVALWRGYSRADLARLAGVLHPAGAEPLTVGTDLALDVTAAEVPVKVPVRLAAVVGAPGEPPHTVTLGQLVKGTHEYRAPVPACTAGCRLVGLAVGRATVSTDPLTVALSVDAIRTGTSTLAAGFDQAGRWRTAAGGATVHAGPALTVNVSSTDPADAIVDYLDSPDRLPAVVAGRVPADDEHAATFQFPGFAEQPQPFAVAAHAAALPRAGAHGLLFDLDYAVRSAERTSSLADNNTLRYEVWAGPDAPADLERRLTGAGLEVVRAESVTGTVDQLSRRAPALGLWLYLLAGAAALLLAVGVVLLTAYVGVQGRLYELAALRVAGVRARILRRAVLGEYRLLLGAPLLVGFVAGVAGALVMLPGIPLVTAGTPTGTVSWRPGPSGALPVAAAATVVGLALAVLVVLRLLHRATPERLREGTR